MCSCFRLINTDLSLLFQTDSCQCLWCGLTGRFCTYIIRCYSSINAAVNSCRTVRLHRCSVSGSHKDTETLIRWRMTHGYLFSGWRNTCRNGWEYVLIVIYFTSALRAVCIQLYMRNWLLLLLFYRRELVMKGFSNF